MVGVGEITLFDETVYEQPVVFRGAVQRFVLHGAHDAFETVKHGADVQNRAREGEHGVVHEQGGISTAGYNLV